MRRSIPLPLAIGAVLATLPATSAQAQESAAAEDMAVIEAEDYAFDAPDEIPSGWTNIQFENTGEEPHVLLLTRMPEGRGLEDLELELSPHFIEAWEQVRAGQVGPDEALALIGEGAPEWSADLQYLGGVGIIPEGEAGEVALDLEPGTYVIECYMKTEDGDFHSTEGMIRELEVTEEDSGLAPPEADASLTLTNAGIEVEGDLTAGRRTVAVTAAEWPDFMFGHNLHLAHEPPLDTEKDEILDWLNFMGIEGLIPPAPLEFHGGMNILPPGETGYFTVDLEPGRYMLVSETAPWGWEDLVREISVDP